MSSGAIGNARWRNDPDGSVPVGGGLARDGSLQHDGAFDTLFGMPFKDVELPSRRWYIEASSDRAGGD